MLCRADDAGEGGCLRPVLDVHGVPGCCRRLLRVVHNGDQVGLVVSWGALLCPLALKPGQEFLVPFLFPHSHTTFSLCLFLMKYVL